MADRLNSAESAASDASAPPDSPARLDIEQLIREYHADLYRYAFRLAGSVPDAEDLTQQTFLIVQGKLHQVRDAEKVRSWLYAVLRSCFLKSLRKSVPLTATVAELSVDQIPQQMADDDSVDRQQLQWAIDGLPDDFKLVVLMFYFEDFSYKQIAAELDIPIGTVMSRLARAKGRLRQILTEAGHDGRHSTEAKETASVASAHGGQSSSRRESR